MIDTNTFVGADRGLNRLTRLQKKGFRDARTFLLHVMSQQNYMFDRDQ